MADSTGNSRIVTNSNCFISIFTIAPGKRDAFLEIFDPLWREFAHVSERETNFVYYGWGRDPNQFYAVESWKDDSATNQLRAEPRFQQEVGRLIELCSAPMQMIMLSGYANDRSVFDMFPVGPSEVHPSGDGKVTTFA